MKNMTLKEAKELFFYYNCSLFTMGRENLPKYQLYRSLNVDKDLENEWREEQLALYYKNIENNDSNQNSWIIFNKMYSLFENTNSKASLSIMLKALKKLLDILKDKKDKIIVTEVIIGDLDRSCRSGLIYMAYDLGDKEKASMFANYALQLLEGTSEDTKLQNRVENAKEECLEIIKELSLDYKMG